MGWLLDRSFGPRVAFAVNVITALDIFLLARSNDPIVHGLEKKGLLRSKQQRVNGKIRRVYLATPSGRKALEAAKQRVRELFGELFEH